MSHHKKKHNHPIPPANQPQPGPVVESELAQQTSTGGGVPLQELDPKRQFGGYEGAGEHARQQPSQINDGQQHQK